MSVLVARSGTFHKLATTVFAPAMYRLYGSRAEDQCDKTASAKTARYGEETPSDKSAGSKPAAELQL